MSNYNEKEGSLPLPAAQPATNETSEADTDKREICRKFVWGTCTKKDQCKFRHALVFKEMTEILKFCHDYQNRTGCRREGCTYLHTTSEEEKLFLTTGKLPKVLAERHAAMAAAETNTEEGETVPYTETHMNGTQLVSPPPPPPTSKPSSAPVPGTVLPPPPPPPPAPPVTANVFLIQPPPPPPPVTACATISSNHSAPVPQKTSFTLPMFDASQPPPPLPGHLKSYKRKLPDCIGDVSKSRRIDAHAVPDAGNKCDRCAQRELRLQWISNAASKLRTDVKNRIAFYGNSKQDYEKGKQLLMCLVDLQTYKIFDEFIEEVHGQESVDLMLQFLSQSSGNLMGSTNVQKKMLFKLMETCLNPSRVAEESTSLEMDDLLLNITNETTPRTTSGYLESLFNLLCNPHNIVERNDTTSPLRTTESVHPPFISLTGNLTASRPPLPAAVTPHSTPYPTFHPAVPPPTPVTTSSIHYYPGFSTNQPPTPAASSSHSVGGYTTGPVTLQATLQNTQSETMPAAPYMYSYATSPYPPYYMPQS